jgi:hypothetical protein
MLVVSSLLAPAVFVVSSLFLPPGELWQVNWSGGESFESLAFFVAGSSWILLLYPTETIAPRLMTRIIWKYLLIAGMELANEIPNHRFFEHFLDAEWREGIHESCFILVVFTAVEQRPLDKQTLLENNIRKKKRNIQSCMQSLQSPKCKDKTARGPPSHRPKR